MTKFTQTYPTDLKYSEWLLIQKIVPSYQHGRPCKWQRWQIINALLYITRTGCQWRMLPKDLPPWRVVYWYFMMWKKDGTFDRLNDLLRGDLRQAHGRQRQPTAAILDSQSARTTEKGGRTAMTPVRGSTAA